MSDLAVEISLTGLYQSLMRDIPISEYDRRYVLQRLAAEGVHFLTVELPKISKAVISGLETGHFDRITLTSFRFKNSTLAFCGELLNKIFSKESGALLLIPDGVAVGTIRQLCEYSYKLALPFTREQEDEARSNFVNNESDLHGIGGDPEVLKFAHELRKDFETHWSTLASKHSHEILKEFRPRPTNGTFVNCDEFYFIDRNSTSSTRVYPSDIKSYKGFFKPYAGIRGTYPLTGIREPFYSELLLVPKDSRGPRTICRESLKRVETQMSYFDFMISGLNRVSQGAVNFLDQLVNRKIAEESSVSKSYSTLDLKDASDRVSYRVMATIFENCPGLRWFLKGSRRATHVLIDQKLKEFKHLARDSSEFGLHKLNKLAGMGSGLTFPSMSLLISLAICYGVKKHFVHLQYEDIRKDVFVYGDDICVPTKWADIAIIYLAKIGLKVNVTKSFIKGNFRESCGGDYFNGLDVTPCRIKLTNSTAIRLDNGAIGIADNAMAFKQLYEHTKELWKHGLKGTAKYLMSVLDRFYKKRFNVSMPAGGFDVKCSLPINFTVGTGHYDVFASTDVYTIQPVRRVGLDDHSVVSREGKVYRLDPNTHLGRCLRAGPQDQSVYCDKTKRMVYTTNNFVKQDNLINYERTSPSVGKRFGEVTSPRELTFRKVSVCNDFLVENFSRTRDWFEEKVKNDTFWNGMAALFVLTHDRAYL